MMRVQCVELTQFVFGQAEWGGHRIVVPVLPGSTVYADRVRCTPSPVGTRPAERVDALVSSPMYVRNTDGSLTIYEVEGGNLVSDDTLRGDAALSAWDAWLGGVGTTDAGR